VLFGGIALAISFALFWGPKYWLLWLFGISEPANWQIFTWYIVCYLLYYTSHTVSVVPYYALGAELTDDYNERTRVTALRHLIALPAVPLAALTYRLATDSGVFPQGEKLGMMVCTAVVAVIVVVFSMVTTFASRERVEIQKQPKMPMGEALKITFANRPFLMLSGCIFFFQMAYLFVLEFHSYVAIYTVFGGDKGAFARYFFTATFVMISIAAVANFTARGFAKRVGKKIGLVVFASAGLLTPLVSTFAFNADHPELYFVFAVAVAIGISGIEILSFSIIADICDLDELTSHRRREGAFMGVYNGIFKAGMTLSPIIAGWCLQLCGFNASAAAEGLPQNDDTLTALRIALVAVTFILFGFAALFAMALPIRRSDVEAAQAELKRRSEESGGDDQGADPGGRKP
jgi:GPH family glycoside/pentoside/hexuronide:cation symporter